MICLVSADATLSRRPRTGLSGTCSYTRLRLRVCAGCERERRRPEVSPRPGSRVAPSLAMSYHAAAERGSQPAQRDELAHSQTVPIGDGVLPPTIDTPDARPKA